MFKVYKIYQSELIKVTNIWIITLLIFLSIALFSDYLLMKEIILNFEKPQINYNDIVFNNLKFIFIYSVPYGGACYFILTFVYSAFLFNIYFKNNGFELIKLAHIPLEIYAFVIPVAISLKVIRKDFIKWWSLAIIILLLAAYVELNFAK